MDILIFVISFICFLASLFVGLDARIQVKKEEEVLERIVCQVEEYTEAVKRLEALKQELGYSQKNEQKVEK